MSNVQTSAPRMEQDLSHFGFTTGSIGRLKTLAFHPVLAGDSYELDMVGALRLSPLRRGLAVDCRTEVFSFYVPFRMLYDFDTWHNFLLSAGGNYDAASPWIVPTIGGSNAEGVGDGAMYLGTRTASDGTVPSWLVYAYDLIYNHYFRHPQDRPFPPDLQTLDELDKVTRLDGRPVYHIPDSNFWASVPDNHVMENNMDESINTDGLTLERLNASYGMLQSTQERSLFMNRYRDLIKDFGGYASPDAEGRPVLMMHSSFWSSGYDVNGTDQTSLGQFSGRVQQAYKHSVPRFFVPEHGVVMTLMVNRFPPTSQTEMHYLVGNKGNTYHDLAGDINIWGNSGSIQVKENELFHSGSADKYIHVPHGHWFRCHPSHVDWRYTQVEGFPFLTADSPFAESNSVFTGLIDSLEYDKIFSSFQLGHWNSQAKFNLKVYRTMPTARQSLLTAE